MKIEVNYLMRCCGVKEINGLSYFDTSEAAMLDFCKRIYPTQKQVQTRWDETILRAKQAGVDPNDTPGYFGGWTTDAVYDNVEQYSKFRFAIFTEAVHPTALAERRTGNHYEYGRNFAQFIQKNKLGSLVTTSSHELNSNSGQMVKVWVWGIDHDALKAWYKKENPSWAQKPMSDVIASAASAGSFFGSQLQGLGNTLGNVLTSSGVSMPLGSPQQGSRTNR